MPLTITVHLNKSSKTVLLFIATLTQPKNLFPRVTIYQFDYIRHTLHSKCYVETSVGSVKLDTLGRLPQITGQVARMITYSQPIQKKRNNATMPPLPIPTPQEFSSASLFRPVTQLSPGDKLATTYITLSLLQQKGCGMWDVKIFLHCPRCDSWRMQSWAMSSLFCLFVKGDEFNRDWLLQNRHDVCQLVTRSMSCQETVSAYCLWASNHVTIRSGWAQSESSSDKIVVQSKRKEERYVLCNP